MKLVQIPMHLVAQRNLDHISLLEARVAARSDAVHAGAHSPERFDILAEALKQRRRMPAPLRAVPHFVGSIAGIRRSLQTLGSNPSRPRTRIPASDLAELDAYARAAGIDEIGYARVSRELVFRNKAVLHENAIVLAMEMDHDRIATSPSEQSFVEVHATYHHLGVAANRIAGWLRQQGYSAHAGHPLMGLALYPPLGQQAGLGWRGLHGLLITPRFGPRVRLAAVFTSVENLPFGAENRHAWIEDYCARCRLCARECPPHAIYEQPIAREEGRVTCISTERCFPYFVDNYGCSICIRVCPFQKQDYALLKELVSTGR